MVAVSVLFMGVVLLQKRISRMGGVLLLSVYAAYMAYLFVYTRTI